MTLTPEQIELREKWVLALESGEYQQCRTTLYNGVGYCCLGVAEKVAGNEFVQQYADCTCEACQISPPDYVVSGTRESVSLTEETAELLGFKVYDPRVWVQPPVKDGQEFEEENPSLATLNDKYGFTFAEIAAAIRVQPEDWDGDYR